MEISWKYVKPLKNPSAVRDYLRINKVDLPEKLICALETYNGGRPSEKRVITSSHKEYVFNSLLSYNREDKETIYDIYPALFKGTELYPIGRDPAGNFVCYKTDSEEYVLWNHEINDEETIIDLPFIKF